MKRTLKRESKVLETVKREGLDVSQQVAGGSWVCLMSNGVDKRFTTGWIRLISCE